MTAPAPTYHFFWNGPFSQWHPSGFELDGVAFITAEQAMMYLKALLFGDESTAALILKEAEPGRQKALGRRVRGFDEAAWDSAKYDIVKRVSLAKYTQNKGLRRKLFQTAPSLLVEASPVDVVWGIGLDARQAAETPSEFWPGQNLLGQILTETRSELAAAFPDEARACSTDNQET